MRATFVGEVWMWDQRNDSWAFVTLPEDLSDAIEHAQAGPRRGFGAVKVRVTAGATTWTTSVFPSKQARAYILPVKKSVRAAEGLNEGDRAEFAIELIAPF